MAMRPCTACLENRWKFLYDENIVTATCQNCEREVSFAARKKPVNPHRPRSSIARMILAISAPCPLSA